MKLKANIFWIIVIFFLSCSGEKYVKKEAEPPDWYTKPPKAKKGTLFFAGFSGDDYIDRKEAIEKAEEDAKKQASAWALERVKNMYEQGTFSVTANKKEEISQTLKEVTQIYTSAELKRVRLIERKEGNNGPNRYYAYALIEVKEKDIKPNKEKFIDTLKKEANSLRFDFLCYNKSTGRIRTLNTGDTIQTGEYIKMNIETDQGPRYLYIFNTDSHGKVYTIFPRKEIPFSNPIQANKRYTLPEGDEWYKVDDQTGTETMNFILLKKDDPTLNEMAKLMDPKRNKSSEKDEKTSSKLKRMLGAFSNNISIPQTRSVKAPESKRDTEFISQEILSFGSGAMKQVILNHID